MSESKQGSAEGYSAGEKYYVEKLVGKRRLKSGKVEYRVKWWGWKSSSNTWEDRAILMEDCPNLVIEFENANERKRPRKQRQRERPSTTAAAAAESNAVEGEQGQADTAQAMANDDDDRGDMVHDPANEDSAEDEIEILEENPAPKRHSSLEQEKNQMKKRQTSAVPVQLEEEPLAPPMQKKKVNKKQSPKKRKSRKGQRPEVSKMKYIPERILGITQDPVTEELQFLIKWKDRNEANLVPASRAHIGCPQLVIQFYENRLIWRAEDGTELDLLMNDESEESDKGSLDGYHSDFDWQIIE